MAGVLDEPYGQLSLLSGVAVQARQQGSTYWKIPPPQGGGGGINMARGGKNIIKTTCANKKRRKERKYKGKEMKNDKITEQEQCSIKLWETWKKMQAIGDITSYFFPYYFNCHA